MKINSLSAYKPSFGHISTRTIDMIRKHTEGYRKTINSSNPDENGSYYNNSSKYQFLNTQQLIRLEKLTKKASDLQKSVIDVPNNSWAEDGSIPKFVVRSHIFGGGIRGNVEIFAPKYDEISDSIGAINPDSVLDSLEKAVDYAKEVEKDSNAHDVYDVYGWHAGIRDCKGISHRFDRFRSNGTNELLYLIYSNTLDLMTIK